MNAFTPSPLTRGRRRPERVAYDEAAVYAVLDAAVLGHVGYVIEGQPLVTPTAYWREGRKLYWHGAAASRMLQTVGAGMPVCVTVSLLDGLVLGASGFTHSINYRSAMVFGRARLISDLEAKRRAMDAFIDRLYPGRAATLRPASEAELKQIALAEMTIEQASAKVREGGLKPYAPDDGLPGWRGVIPVETSFGDRSRRQRASLRPRRRSPGSFGFPGLHVLRITPERLAEHAVDRRGNALGEAGPAATKRVGLGHLDLARAHVLDLERQHAGDSHLLGWAQLSGEAQQPLRRPGQHDSPVLDAAAWERLAEAAARLERDGHVRGRVRIGVVVAPPAADLAQRRVGARLGGGHGDHVLRGEAGVPLLGHRGLRPAAQRQGHSQPRHDRLHR
jgi:nitroimidazol reductase NimA-like FMN-containing flavoprotein (pyridoxamine 5'-phosphate oxidase superfamily)